MISEGEADGQVNSTQSDTNTDITHASAKTLTISHVMCLYGQEQLQYWVLGDNT